MSGLQMTTENSNIASIMDQIKASQQKVLQAFEDHNNIVNKSLELLQQLKTKVEVVKVKDPLEELKKVRDEFDKNVLTDIDLEPIKKSTKKWLESTYENSPKNILRTGWIESITFRNCQNIKSVILNFQDAKDEITFRYPLDEKTNECILYFGTPDSTRIINNTIGPEAPDTIHTSMFPISILPYQHIYFTCEKIDETKPCYATMCYECYDIVVPYKLCLNRIRFTIQDKTLFIRAGTCDPDKNLDLVSLNTKGEYLITLIDILCLYGPDKISTSFKEIFLKIFKTILDANNQGNINQLKQRILTVRDIRWLLLEMEKYPQYFGFSEDDLTIMKENGASRDNIYLVKKFLKKDGDYEEYYNEEEGGGIKCKYHMSGGQMNGEYIFWYPTGQLWGKRYYKDGKKEGEAKEWYENGTLLYQICYKDGEPEGEFKRWHDNGQLMYQKHFKEGKFDGEYKEYYRNGQLGIQCCYKEGKPEGEYKKWYENGQLYIQKYCKEGKNEGDCKLWHPNGQLNSQGYYKEGKREGDCKWWHQNGNLYFQGYYKEDKEEGDCKWWHQNGNLGAQEYYKEGKREGEYKKWDEDGKLKEQCVYENGVKV